MIAIVWILASLAQETLDNPEYKGWSSFKPGSSVTYKFIRNGAPQEGSQKSTLKSINETEAVLEAEIVKDGAVVGKAFERKISAKVLLAPEVLTGALGAGSGAPVSRKTSFSNAAVMRSASACRP